MVWVCMEDEKEQCLWVDKIQIKYNPIMEDLAYVYYQGLNHLVSCKEPFTPHSKPFDFQ